MRQIFFLIFSLAVYSVNSQTFNYKHYSVEDGLASSTVYAAIQDRNGFMWFATENGVNRFDGNSFAHYSVDDGLSDNDVFRIFEDSKGRIWFLTANGHLSFYEDGEIHNEKTDTFLLQMHSTAGYCMAFEDSRKRVWFCSINSRVSVLADNNVIRIPPLSSNPNSGVGVFEDSLKNMYVICESQRYLFDEKKQSLIHISPYAGAVHSSYFLSPKGQMFFISFNEIFQIDNATVNSLYTFKNTDLTRVDILSATNGINNSIYICTKKGVISLVHGTRQADKFLPEYWINSVTVDKEENIWFMTRGSGIFFLPKQYREQKIYNKLSLSNDDIHSLAVGKDGSIWMGCSNNSASVLENNNVSNIHLPIIKKRSGRITYLDTDKEGNIWCCSDFNFYKIDATNHKVKMLADTSAVRILNISFNSKGIPVIAMPESIGSVTENKNHLYINILKDSTLNKRMYCVFYDLSDHLFFANINGLYEMIENKVVAIGDSEPLLNTKIISISQAKDSSLVLGTDGYGVIIYKNGKIISHITSKQGLSSSICRKIRIYGEKIFACTNKGLTQFKYQDGITSDFISYNISNGLPSGDVRDVIVENGIMYVATSRGLAVLEENAPLETTFAPGIYIKEVLNNVRQMNFDSAFTVPFRNNTLTVKYSAITFSSSDEVIYEYSIHSDSNETKQTKLTELTFPDISPGEYTFSVRAKKKNSAWSALTVFSFNVEYPYYQRWWFYTLVILCMLGGLTIVFIYLHRRSMRMQFLTLEKRNALNIERNRISADMHDDLGADLSRIVVISELIKFTSKHDHPVHSSISKISEYATGATKKMDDIIWALNPQNDSLRNLIGYINQYLYNLFLGTGTTVEIGTDETIIDLPLNAKQRRNIFLVIKEIANNVLKYADADNFFISFKIENNILHIVVGDNGKGFEENGINEYGNGLKNISKRISELHGTVTRKSAPFKGTWYEINLHLNGIS